VLGLPLIGSHVAQLAITITDTVMLGWYAVEALAAVTLASSFAFVIFIVGSGFAFAVLPMVASAMAEDDETQVRRVTRMGMWISALYGACVLPLMIWSKPILLALGQTPEIADLASSYLSIYAIGMIPALLVMVLKNYLAAMEHTQSVLWITIVAALVNGVFNYALIFGNFGAPELGIRGAAISSVVVQIASVLMVAVYINWVFPHHAMFQRFWRPDPEAFARTFRLGWPIGLTNLAESGLFSATAVLMGWLGALALAAHGVALQLASITFLFHLGLSQAATVRAGRAMGRQDGRGLRDGAKVAIAMSLVFGLLTVAILLTVPEFLLRLFLDPTDPALPDIIAIGVTLLAVAALFQVVDGAQVIALGLLRGLQDTRIPMLHAALSYWVIGMPACYIMGFWLDWQGVGVWMGLVVGLSAASALLMHRFWTKGVSSLPVV